MFFCFGYAVHTIQIHMVPYGTDQGIPAATAASILAIVGGASVVGRVALGSVGDRTGNKQTFRTSFILMLLALVWLLFTREVWGLYLFSLVFGIGYGGCTAQTSPLITKLFGLKSLGVIFGLAVMGFSVGSAIGPFVSGYIFDITGNYYLAFEICIAILVIGILVNVTIRPTLLKIAGKL